MKEIAEFKYIPVDSIHLDQEINEPDIRINDIIKQIKDKGLIRPLIISKINNKFILKLGVRRFLAFKELNLSLIHI